MESRELREFLAADVLHVAADPVFKERLREKLWRVVLQRFGTPESQATLPKGTARKSGTYGDSER